MSKFLTLCIVVSALLLSSCQTNRQAAVHETPKQPGNASAKLATSQKVLSDLERGYQHLLGHGVPASDAEAVVFFKRAAKEGNALAQNQLAYLYARGRGVPQDYREALRYYLLAANQDLASAQYSAGLCYLHGLGTTRDVAQAKEWFSRAKIHGFEPAKAALDRLN
jgi:TPR repeat protein